MSSPLNNNGTSRVFARAYAPQFASFGRARESIPLPYQSNATAAAFSCCRPKESPRCPLSFPEQGSDRSRTVDNDHAGSRSSLISRTDRGSTTGSAAMSSARCRTLCVVGRQEASDGAPRQSCPSRARLPPDPAARPCLPGHAARRPHAEPRLQSHRIVRSDRQSITMRARTPYRPTAVFALMIAEPGPYPVANRG